MPGSGSGRRANYENLPIYKTALDLVVFLEKAVMHFPRYHRYAVGADLRNKAREVVNLVIRANLAGDKIPALTELRDAGEEMKLTVVIGKEIQAFRSFKEFQRAALLAAEIGRQSQGWLNSQRRKMRPESPTA